MRKSLYLILSSLLLLSHTAFAQVTATYPVQASIQVRYPSVWLEDYSQGFDERVSVVLLNRDALSAGLDVRLRITVSCPGGVTLRTKPSAVFSPVTLYAGMPERLSMAELAPYFLPQNLDITGRLENGALPEGPARFTVEALEYHTGVQVSLPGVTIANLSVQKPPVLLFPQNGGTVRYMEPLSLMFRWNTLSTTLNRQQPYQFILKEIADAGANATSAFNYSQPVYETETYANTLIYGVAEPPLEAGKTYAWAVRSQEPHCLNGGWSEVFTFTLDTLKGVGGTAIDTVQPSKVSRAAACGEDNYRVTNLTPAESLSVGDTITVGGGFKVRVTELIPSGSEYSGAGLMFIPYIGVDFAVTLHSVVVNTDRQLISGYTEVVHDESNAQIGGTDALLYGGTTKLKNGVVLPDVEADFQFPVPVTAALDTVKNTIVFYNADGTAAGSVKVPLNDAGEPVFPVKVRDADGKMVQINEAGEDEEDSNGERPLTVTELGTETAGDYIPERMLSNVRSDIGEVEFLDSDGSQYSFDSPLPYYESVAVLLNSDGSNGGRVYRKAEPDYQVQWKFMETGATDKVRARLTLTKEGREEIRQPERLVFKTPAESGSVTLPSEYNPADGTYTVTVTGTQPDTKQTVLALYPYSGTYFCLGMLDIDTRQRQTAKVCLVNLGGDYDRNAIESGINSIYSKAGISWQVTEESGFTYPQDSLALLFDTKESGGPLYSLRQGRLNADFATYMAERYDSGTCYLFLYSNPKGSKSRDVAGYMPRGGQFGYINTARLSQAELPAVAAHELGHGRFRLRHIFDGDYGTVASRQKGRTDNLMDYASNPAAATHIAK
ncbi:MAG: hypothetical protein IJP50_02475, partial [Paludibacteraceae bacterium]|nr:hypothetical protein [Paludibacteraceae bacterium]